MNNRVMVKLASGDYGVMAIDSTHVTMTYEHSQGKGAVYHVAQLDDDTVRQLQACGFMDDRKYVNIKGDE